MPIELGREINLNLQDALWTLADRAMEESTPALIARMQSAASTNPTLVKAGKLKVYGWTLINTALVTRYVKLYDTATKPTAGQGTPAFTIAVPPGLPVLGHFGKGIGFANGLGYTTTTLPADTASVGVEADGITGALLYV